MFELRVFLGVSNCCRSRNIALGIIRSSIQSISHSPDRMPRTITIAGVSDLAVDKIYVWPQGQRCQLPAMSRLISSWYRYGEYSNSRYGTISDMECQKQADCLPSARSNCMVEIVNGTLEGAVAGKARKRNNQVRFSCNVIGVRRLNCCNLQGVHMAFFVAADRILVHQRSDWEHDCVCTPSSGALTSTSELGICGVPSVTLIVMGRS